MPHNCTPAVNVDKYAVDAEACKQLPLDGEFLNSFNGGSKNKNRNKNKSRSNNKSRNKNKSRNNNSKNKRKSRTKKRTRKNQKAGSVGYVLDLESPTMGGLARVKGYSSQPIYQDGQMQDSGEICGGGKRRKSRKSRKSRKGRKGRKGRKDRKGRNSKSKSRRNKVKGGGEGLQSVFTHNMNDRQFGCRQPEWDPKCT